MCSRKNFKPLICNLDFCPRFSTSIRPQRASVAHVTLASPVPFAPSSSVSAGVQRSGVLPAVGPRQRLLWAGLPQQIQGPDRLLPGPEGEERSATPNLKQWWMLKTHIFALLFAASTNPEEVPVHQVSVLRRCQDPAPMGERNPHRQGESEPEQLSVCKKGQRRVSKPLCSPRRVVWETTICQLPGGHEEDGGSVRLVLSLHLQHPIRLQFCEHTR